MKSNADALGAGTYGTQQTQSTPNLKWPGVRVQADGGASAAEAFVAGWLDGSLFRVDVRFLYRQYLLPELQKMLDAGR